MHCRVPAVELFRIIPTKASKSLKNSKMKIIWPQIREFCACIFYRLSHCALRRFRSKCATFCPLSFCRKGLAGLRRGPYGVATGLPLSPDGAAVATPGGPPGSAAAFFLEKNGDGTGKRQRFSRSSVSILRFFRGPFLGMFSLQK